MSMFDWYYPATGRKCPVCGNLLREWQGKDGPNGLFEWKEGVRSPVGQVVDEDARIDRQARERLGLPDRFVIYSYDCPDHQPIEANCRASDGAWSDTEVQPFKLTGTT